MADQQTEAEETSAEIQGEQPESRECMACSGTGKVTSNLGGEPKEVDCPWCEGTGTEIPDHDAQAKFKQERAE